jgi:hypothetical protein
MATEDWEAIEQVRAAVADIERLRADTLQLLHESSALLDQIDRINRPLIALPTARERRSARQFAFLSHRRALAPEGNIPETSKV